VFARVCHMTPHIIPLDLLISILFCEERAREGTIKNLIFIWLQLLIGAVGTRIVILIGAVGTRIVNCTQEMKRLTCLQDKKDL
jgi:hypothetical protein